ncbi:MAG: hypothetical protein HWN79_11525 [Candidatus Lokiarchaeota archaeon]|nr:hypothetical protein [Candidatus Lokiarchaeota archaeon]
MIPRKIFETLTNNYVYIYIRGIEKEFSGKIISLDDSDILKIEDKNNNIINVAISDIAVITERR